MKGKLQKLHITQEILAALKEVSFPSQQNLNGFPPLQFISTKLPVWHEVAWFRIYSY